MGLTTLLSNPRAFLIQLLYLVPSVVLCLSVHEAAHAYAALRMGDESQRYRGRITLNPFAHVDPFGFLMLLLLGFGWAKPVQINPYTFRKPKTGMAVTALAGPISNFLLMAVALFLATLFGHFASGAEEGIGFLILYVLTNFFFYLGMLSAGLGLFNLIPIPPLDGSRVVARFLHGNAALAYARLERYGFYILAGLLLIGNYVPRLDFIGNWLNVARDFLVNGCLTVFSSIIR